MQEIPVFFSVVGAARAQERVDFEDLPFQPAKLGPAVRGWQQGNWLVATYRFRRVFMAPPQAMTWLSMVLTAASW